MFLLPHKNQRTLALAFSLLLGTGAALVSQPQCAAAAPAAKTASAAPARRAVTPGHPFSIQDKAENYHSTLDAAATKNLNAALARRIGGYGDSVPGLSVLIYRDGKEVYRNSMGNAFLSPNNAKWNLPVMSTTRFRVASLSKICTAIGIMQLVEQGKLDLDGDAGSYLGFRLRNPHYPSKVITPRMLLSHTSSLRDNGNNYIPASTSLRSFFASGRGFAGAGRAPGTYFSYCNSNYIVLGTILERLSGERFDRYMTNHVLAPLEIYGSFNMNDFSNADLAKLGANYRKPNGVRQPYVAAVDGRPIRLQPPAQRISTYQIGTNAALFGPQGNLRVSTVELSHLLQMFLNNGTYNGKQILRPVSVATMTKPVWTYNPSVPNGTIDEDNIEQYGLAMQYMSGKGTTKPAPNRPDFDLVGHFGEAYGFIGGLFWQPGTKNGFVFIQNGCATPEEDNPGRYSRSYRCEEDMLQPIIENAFPANTAKKGK